MRRVMLMSDKWSRWFKYDGDGCPVPEDTMVRVFLRNVEGAEDWETPVSREAGEWDWSIEDGEGDITWYCFKVGSSGLEDENV
jgi:hypothetical protein